MVEKLEDRTFVVQRKTGKVLGTTTAPCFGKYLTVPYMTERALTNMKYRYRYIGTSDGVKPVIIAHGCRDASMLPGFEGLGQA